MTPRDLPSFVTIENWVAVDRPIGLVWSRVGAYAELDRFLDVTCEQVAGDGGLGSVRLLNGAVVEPMVGQSEYSYTYAQTRGPMSAHAYHGCLRCDEVGPSKTKIVYTLVYDETGIDEDRRASERERLRDRFAGAVRAMKMRVDADAS